MSTTRVPPARTTRPTPPSSARRPAGPPVAEPVTTQPTHARIGVRRLFRAENSNYFLVLGTTLFLVALGLVIVLSSSSVEAFASTGNAFTDFLKQGLFALIGIPVMLAASRAPSTFWRKWAWLALGVALALQLLVFTPLGGSGAQYNRNWVYFPGGFGFQPSELIKLTLIIWMSYVLTRKQELIGDWKHALLPVGPVAALALLLVLAGNDIGTAAIILVIVYSVLFFVGVKLRHLAASFVLIAVVGAGVVFSGSSRSTRISSWLSGGCTSADVASADCWQPVHGMWGLASGGIFGVGLGNSKMKWNWLPAADNDFIFAIIGEELGLIGVIVVLALFVVLAIGFVRVARTATDPAGRIIAGGVLVWVIGQALVNIAVVLGLLPVLGVPLPLISAGGSALLTTLLGIGIVLSFARDRGDAAAPIGRTPRLDSPAERSRAAARSRSTSR